MFAPHFLSALRAPKPVTVLTFVCRKHERRMKMEYHQIYARLGLDFKAPEAAQKLFVNDVAKAAITHELFRDRLLHFLGQKYAAEVFDRLGDPQRLFIGQVSFNKVKNRPANKAGHK
jgi:hypothetical protein